MRQMRKWYTLVAAGAVAAGLGMTGAAAAATLEWAGTLVIDLGATPPVVATGTGVATVNGSSGLGHLNTLRLAGGISASTTLPATDPDVPTLVSVRATAQLGTGTFSGISGAPPLTGSPPLPSQGVVRLCLGLPGCGVSLPIPMTAGGTAGVGIGGLVTVNGYGAGIQVSLTGAPWTIGTGSVTGIPTANGATSAATAQGFAHGPVSGTSSTATLSGAVRLVTPVRVETTFPPPADVVGMLGILTLRFIPEPGMLVLLASGIAGLVLLGRDRMPG
jgi:hypothetical protein